MRLTAAALAAALAALPAVPGAAADSAHPTPAPKADASPTTPKADAAPKADASPGAPKADVAPKANAPSSRSGSATRPPAAANDLARALLTSEQWSKVLDSYASSLAAQISQALQSKGEKVPENLRGNLRTELEKTLPYQQTVQTQAEALAKSLSADELRRTAAFYGSPLGRKVLDKLPEAQSEVAQELQGRLSTAVPEIVNRLAPKAMAGGPGAGGPEGPSTGTGSSGGAEAAPGGPGGPGSGAR
jgi:hypothetical protein